MLAPKSAEVAWTEPGIGSDGVAAPPSGATADTARDGADGSSEVDGVDGVAGGEDDGEEAGAAQTVGGGAERSAGA